VALPGEFQPVQAAVRPADPVFQAQVPVVVVQCRLEDLADRLAVLFGDQLQVVGDACGELRPAIEPEQALAAGRPVEPAGFQLPGPDAEAGVTEHRQQVSSVVPGMPLRGGEVERAGTGTRRDAAVVVFLIVRGR